MTAESAAKKPIEILIDGQKAAVEEGTTILEAARRLGIYIPTLCYHEDLRYQGSCRICVVEVKGANALKSACSFPITQSIEVQTSTPDVRRARRHILELLLGDHYGECYSCYRNGACELQKLAEEYGIDELLLGHINKPKYEVLVENLFVRDMNKCIGCLRCVRTCDELQVVNAIGKHGRGNKLRITTFADLPLLDALCVGCGQCVNRCPTAALIELDQTEEVWEAIDDPNKHVVIQTAPAPRAAIGECFGLPPGSRVTKRLNTALRQMGFDKVFDTNFTADLTIIEEGMELLHRLSAALKDKNPNAKPLPQFTSCSPGWVKFMEHVAPERLAHLSTAKSPQQMFGAIAKTWYAQMNGIDPATIVNVSLMPCTAKKFEAARPEMNASGFRDVDYVLTTRELARMIKQSGLDLPSLTESDFDDPLGIASGAGQIFGVTGGVMEAAIRTAYELVTGEEVPFDKLRVTPVRGMMGIRTADIPISKAKDEWKFLEGATLRVMIAHGLSNARRVLEMLNAGELDSYHFVEIMACPGGCLGGGGQPFPTSFEIRKARARALYDEEEGMKYRKSHENPVVKRIYAEFLTDGPCGKKSHNLLHTGYTPRGTKLK